MLTSRVVFPMFPPRGHKVEDPDAGVVAEGVDGETVELEFAHISVELRFS